MSSLSLSFALKELSSRNSAIAAVYREWAKRLPPGPLTRLTASIAEQRLDLGKALGEVASYRSLPDIEVEFESDPASAAGIALGDGTLEDPKAILKKMAEAEAAEHDLLAALLGAILPQSGPVAERFASEAAGARKRSIWAQDQLDLISL